MLEGKNSTYPHFQCPNCRAWTDLSAEVDVAEEDMEDWMENAGDSEDPGRAPDNAASGPGPKVRSEEDTAQIGAATSTDDNNMPDADQETGSINEIAGEPTSNQPTSLSALLARRQAAQPASGEIASVNGIDLPNQLAPSTTNTTEVDRLGAATPEVGEVLSGEGPLTPRNNAGPFVFDGSGGRLVGRRAVPANGDISE
jgi:E3 ubiquitin-protein ligase DMA1/2